MRIHTTSKPSFESVKTDMIDYLTKNLVPRSRAERLLNDFETAKKKNLIKNNDDKNLQLWMKKPYDDFVDFVIDLSQRKTTTAVKKEEKVAGSELVFEDNNWKIYHIKNHAAAKLLGKGTKWCITVENSQYWDEYSDYSTFYFLISKNETIETNEKFYKIAAQVTFQGLQFWDAQDNEHGTFPLPNKPTFDFPSLIEPFTTKNGVLKVNDSTYTSFTIPEEVTKIGNDAFRNFTNLTSIIIPEGVTSIGDHAFAYCTNLESITIPNSVTSIDYEAFRSCSSLTTVTFGNNSQLTSIGSYAFIDCTSLESITIPEGVTSIGRYAFQNCYSLESLTIPNSVTSIGSMAFSGCPNLNPEDFEGLQFWDAPDYEPAFDFPILIEPYTIEGTVFKRLNDRTLTEFTIPEGITEIDNYAFANCYSLTTITIPDSVTIINMVVFYECHNLTTVTFGDNSQLKEIGGAVFSGCKSLPSITIPEGVTSIGGSVFRDCNSLTSITIPNSVTSISEYAFSDCPNLETISIPVHLNPEDFEGTNAKIIQRNSTATEHQIASMLINL